MNKIILIWISLMTFSLSHGQKRAVTENGEEVILSDNGTWKYKNEEEVIKKVIPTNSAVFKKDNKASFLLKSNKLNIGIYLNPKKWSFKKAINNPDAEFELKLKGEDLYGMIITEKIEIPLEALKSIALENGKVALPDLKIINEEYRMVNGLKVLHLKMNGSLQGIKFSYYGYYYSDSNGTVQFLTYTSQNLQKIYEPEIEKLLNGLIKIK